MYRTREFSPILSSDLIPRRLHAAITPMIPEINAAWWRRFDVKLEGRRTIYRAIFHYFVGLTVSEWILLQLAYACRCPGSIPSTFLSCRYCIKFTGSIVDTAWCIQHYARPALRSINWNNLMRTILREVRQLNPNILSQMIPRRMTRDQVSSLLHEIRLFIGLRASCIDESSFRLACIIKEACDE